MRRLGGTALVVGALVVACGPAARSAGDTPPPAAACADAAALVDEARALRGEGYLGRALDRVDRALALCSSDAARAERDAVRAELWIDGSVAVTAGTASDDDARRARMLYRAGHLLRIVDGDYELSLQRLTESFQLLPHPLTLVQMAMTHRAAGREVEYRKHNARALAVAQHIQNDPGAAVFMLGHTMAVLHVAYHPSLPLLVSGGQDGQVLLWDLTSGRIARTLASYEGVVKSVAISPDGARLVAVVEGVGLLAWRLPDGEPIDTPASGDTRVAAAFFDRDGRRLALVADDTVTVVDVDGWTEQLSLRIAGAVNDIAFSPDGARIAVAGPTATVYSASSGEALHELAPPEGYVWSVAFSPDGAQVATGTTDGVVTQWNAATGDVERERGSAHSAIAALAYSPDGNELAALSVFGLLLRWTSSTDDEPRDNAVDGKILGLAYAPDGLHLALGVDDATIAIFNTGTDTLDRTLAGVGAGVTAVDFSPGGDRLITGGHDGDVRMIDLTTGALERIARRDAMTAALWYRGADSVAIVDFGGAISVLNAAGDEQLRIDSSGDRMSYALSPGGDRIATGRSTGAITVWDLATGARLRDRHGLGGIVHSVAFSPDGNDIAFAIEPHQGDPEAGDRPKIGVWSPGTDALFHPPDNDADMATIVHYHPDGALFASGDNAGRVALLDARDGRRLASVDAHSYFVWSLAFSPDGTRLATGSADRAVKLWSITGESDARALAPIAALTGHSDWVDTLAFSPDGALLASGSLDKTLRLWDGATGALLATVVAAGERWIATTADGRVDGSGGDDGGSSLLYWQVGAIQLPGFVGWQRYHTPGLLGTIAARPGSSP